MKGVNFKSADLIMGAPDGMEDEIYGLPVQKLFDASKRHEGWRSIWLPSDEERTFLGDGGVVELRIFSIAHPPIALNVTSGFEVTPHD